MNVPYTHESIRLTGRWDRGTDCATATLHAAMAAKVSVICRKNLIVA